MLSIDEIVLDPQFLARDTITEVDHPKLGPLKMQNVIPRLVETPGRIRWPGPELGSSNEAVLRDELGLTEEQIAELVETGVVADAAPDDPRSTREERA